MKASALASEKSVKCATVCPISAFLPKLQEFSIRACCDLTVISCGIVSRVYETRPGDTLRLIAGQQLGRRPATGLILAIDEGKCLLVGVAHDETRGGFLDGPLRREAAGLDIGRAVLGTLSSIQIVPPQTRGRAKGSQGYSSLGHYGKYDRS
jgi:hypothetical protein